MIRRWLAGVASGNVTSPPDARCWARTMHYLAAADAGHDGRDGGPSGAGDVSPLLVELGLQVHASPRCDARKGGRPVPPVQYHSVRFPVSLSHQRLHRSPIYRMVLRTRFVVFIRSASSFEFVVWHKFPSANHGYVQFPRSLGRCFSADESARQICDARIVPCRCASTNQARPRRRWEEAGSAAEDANGRTDQSHRSDPMSHPSCDGFVSWTQGPTDHGPAAAPVVNVVVEGPRVRGGSVAVGAPAVPPRSTKGIVVGTSNEDRRSCQVGTYKGAWLSAEWGASSSGADRTQPSPYTSLRVEVSPTHEPAVDRGRARPIVSMSQLHSNRAESSSNRD
jgi:hypothetical protein